MKQIVRIPLMVLVIAGSIPLPAFSQKAAMNLDVDFADFKYDEEVNYLEVYYSINKDGMAYRKAPDTGFETAVHMLVKILDGDSIISARQWQMRSTEEDTAAVDGSQSIIDCVKLTVPPGTYRLAFIARDMINTQNGDSTETDLVIEPIPREQLAASDVQLARSIRRIAPDDANPFYKNSLEVMPNPARVYGQGNKYINFYAELYNIFSTLKDKEFFVKYYITNSDNKDESELSPEIRTRTGTHDSNVIFGALKVGDLQTGSYLFHLEILDPDEISILSKSEKFYVYNTERIPERSDAVAMNSDDMYYQGEFASMSDLEVDDEFARIRYLITTEDLRFFNELASLEEKRKWLFYFWNKHDTDPSTSLNEFRFEYQRRITYANKFFQEMGVEGWTTDRGRVYCIYGEPNYIERFPSEPGKFPYQIWNYYDIEGGSIFVFGDTQANDEYQLLHSDVRGEVKNSSWESMLER
ncbi:GWxTD domain-containing protein [bacterium]|nr:GWxTD domain-containing protein [bacterium]